MGKLKPRTHGFPIVLQRTWVRLLEEWGRAEGQVWLEKM